MKNGDVLRYVSCIVVAALGCMLFGCDIDIVSPVSSYIVETVPVYDYVEVVDVSYVDVGYYDYVEVGW